MSRVNVLLDDVAALREVLKNDKFDPVQVAVLAEAAGANGITCTFSSEKSPIRERDVKLLKEIRQTFLNVRIPVDEQIVRKVLSIAPDMVTFVRVEAVGGHVLPVDLQLHLEMIEEFVPDLQANDISVAILIPPQISGLKTLSKMSVDYVELSALEFTQAADTNEELMALDKLQSAAVGGTKLGFGINCSGGIGFEHLEPLARISAIEDIIIGTAFYQRALLVGVEKAVQEALTAVRLA